MPFPSNKQNALGSKTTHMKVGGRASTMGPPSPFAYIRFGEHERLIPGGDPATWACNAPHGTADGSKHKLLPPGGVAPPLLFTWIAAEAAWERDGGIRMAFPATYLASHGWRYAGPATA